MPKSVTTVRKRKTYKKAGMGAQPLSKERIVETALLYIEENSAEKLTMRKLGQLLKADPSTTYHYFPSKQALLDAISIRLLQEVPIPDPTDADWRYQLRAFARAVRRIAQRHPRAAGLLASLGTEYPGMAERVNAVIAVWERSGLSPEEATSAYLVLSDLVSGAMNREMVRGRPNETPTLPRSRFRFMDTATRDKIFEHGLEKVIDALAGVRTEAKA